jgi:hypothetical protein
MSTYSKNLFDVLAENDNTPVKVEAPAPVVVDKKNVSKLNKEGKALVISSLNPSFFFLLQLSLHSKRQKSNQSQT